LPSAGAGDGNGNSIQSLTPSLASPSTLTSSLSSSTTTNDIRKRTAIQQAKRSAIVEAIFKRVDEHAFKMNNDANADADDDIVTSAITTTTAPITATVSDYFDLLHHFIRLNKVNHDVIRFSQFNSKSATTTTTTTSSSSSKSTSGEMKSNNSRRHQIEKNLRLLELKYKNLREGYQSPKKSSTTTTTTTNDIRVNMIAKARRMEILVDNQVLQCRVLLNRQCVEEGVVVMVVLTRWIV